MSIFNTLYDSAAFSKYQAEDFYPAINEAITESLAEIQQITQNPNPPTFENTIELLAFAGQKLDRLSAMFFNLNSAETNEKLQQEAQNIAPLLSNHQNDIFLNDALFQRIQFVKDNYLPKTEEEEMLLEKTYKQFTRNGANLSPENKEKLREIDAEIALKKLQFSQNVLAATNEYELHITDEARLIGLPDYAKHSAREKAQQKQKEGWIFTLDAPSFIALMVYCEDRNLRKELFLANHQKCFKTPKNDNRENVISLLKLRQARAELLGYASHAAFVLEERMAQSPEKVMEFLNELLEKARPKALEQLQELKKYAFEKDKITDFNKWDTAFYIEKLRKERFDIDDETLKPYFQLERVLEGIFTICGKLYDIYFKRNTEIEVYHPEVAVYEVTDGAGQFVGLLYTDFHPRSGKRNGAWMTSFKNQYKYNGENSRPHISIVCNFTRPTETEPSLLTFNEVTTLFHEFGHALHGILADTTYPTLSGTSVAWDFVELPSQLFENWCYEQEAVSLFAQHYKTHSPIPMDYIQKIKKGANFMQGVQTLRQLCFGFLDMSLHQNPQIEVETLLNTERKAIACAEIYDEIPEETCISTSFSHIFSGGYSAGYYSYKWAEVLDADAFSYFLEEGIFNTEVSNRFKKYILSQGGTAQPMELYERFRGKTPTIDALLKRSFN